MRKLVIRTVPNGDLDKEVFLQALVEWRNTPRHHGASLAQIVFGHPIHSLVPAHHRSFSAEWQQSMADWDTREAIATDCATQRYNECAHSYPPLRIGTPVRVQDTDTGLWDQIGIVIGIGDRRDYRIKKPSGRVLWSNRRFLRTDHTQEACHRIFRSLFHRFQRQTLSQPPLERTRLLHPPPRRST
jgi:hypothetical protein